MSFLNLRAICPASSSASTTICPATRCKPPAKRNNAETSAFLQQVLFSSTRANSSFTADVMAISSILTH